MLLMDLIVLKACQTEVYTVYTINVVYYYLPHVTPQETQVYYKLATEGKLANKLCTSLGKFSSLPNHVNNFVHLFIPLGFDACARLVCPHHTCLCQKAHQSNCWSLHLEGHSWSNNHRCLKVEYKHLSIRVHWPTQVKWLLFASNWTISWTT